MKHRAADRLSRERAEELTRLGPWDVELDWAPTPEMKARERVPFWADASPEERRSIAELYSAFRLRTGVVAYKTLDPARLGGNAPAPMSSGDQGIYEKFTSWLWEMRAAGQRAYCSAIHDALMHERPVLDERRFLAAIGLHVEIRKRAAIGKPLLTSRAFALKRREEEERDRVVRKGT